MAAWIFGNRAACGTKRRPWTVNWGIWFGWACWRFSFWSAMKVVWIVQQYTRDRFDAEQVICLGKSNKNMAVTCGTSSCGFSVARVGMFCTILGMVLKGAGGLNLL